METGFVRQWERIKGEEGAEIDGGGEKEWEEEEERSDKRRRRSKKKKVKKASGSRNANLKHAKVNVDVRLPSRVFGENEVRRRKGMQIREDDLQWWWREEGEEERKKDMNVKMIWIKVVSSKWESYSFCVNENERGKTEKKQERGRGRGKKGKFKSERRIKREENGTLT